MTFAERYGPWAVIAGASEGTGRTFALAVAPVPLPPAFALLLPGLGALSMLARRRWRQ